MLQQSKRARGSSFTALFCALALAACAAPPLLADFEAQDWANARAIDTPVVYRDYLAAHAAGAHAAGARARIEALTSAERDAWAEARTANSEDAYTAFLARYRWSPNAADARARSAALAAPRQAADESAAWADAARADNVDAYEAFLNAWPEGAHSADAHTRLAQLLSSDEGLRLAARQRGSPGAGAYPESTYIDQAQAERDRRDDSAFAGARRLDEPREYERYLRQHPQGAHRHEAQQRITQLQTDDRTAWDRAGLRNDLDAYQLYLNMHPSGEFRDEAQRRISALRARELTPSPFAIAPQPSLPSVQAPAAPASPIVRPRPQMMEVTPFAAPTPSPAALPRPPPPPVAPAQAAPQPAPVATPPAPADPSKDPNAPERRRRNSP